MSGMLYVLILIAHVMNFTSKYGSLLPTVFKYSELLA